MLCRIIGGVGTSDRTAQSYDALCSQITSNRFVCSNKHMPYDHLSLGIPGFDYAAMVAFLLPSHCYILIHQYNLSCYCQTYNKL